MTRPQRLRKIALSLEHASEITIQRVEAELGLGPRRESPDAGRPVERAARDLICECGMTGPCMNPECKHPVIQRGEHE